MFYSTVLKLLFTFSSESIIAVCMNTEKIIEALRLMSTTRVIGGKMSADVIFTKLLYNKRIFEK
jgi:hypothetical protein